MSRMALRPALYVLAVLLWIGVGSRGDTVDVPASKDNTIYAPAFGVLLSNGAGAYTFAGNTALPPPVGDIRRALMAFDVTGHVPAGATITSATLTLHMSKSLPGIETLDLHLLSADWGEGTSNAPGEEGGGTSPTASDVTWQHRFYPNVFWTAAGGDFSSTVSASAAIADVGFYTWGSNAQMVADVQAWLDNPAGNFGWSLIGNEAAAATAKRFDARENPTSANQPKLTVVYTPAADCNHNGVPDTTDLANGTDKDCNRNGIPDECDIAAGTSRDTDHNGIPDECEADCNHNGLPDAADIASGTSQDCNRNGVPDECDIAAGISPDVNRNGIPDECEADCNQNGVPDATDLANGTSLDCNHNGIPDGCDIATGTSRDRDHDGIPDECQPDCNHDGVPDPVDITRGLSLDCNGNGVPDECDVTSGTSPDCNHNGIPDECDIAAGTGLDCNHNGVPDECDLAAGTSVDCNQNGTPDECDIAAKTSLDANGDGVPDECQPPPVRCRVCGPLNPLTFTGLTATYGAVLLTRRRRESAAR